MGLKRRDGFSYTPCKNMSFSSFTTSLGVPVALNSCIYLGYIPVPRGGNGLGTPLPESSRWQKGPWVVSPQVPSSLISDHSLFANIHVSRFPELHLFIHPFSPFLMLVSVSKALLALVPVHLSKI